MGHKPWKYAVVLDAGSSGTRAHVYRWLDHRFAQKEADDAALHSLPAVQTKHKWTKKIRPGISSFADNPDKIGPDHLQELLDHILDVIPAKAIHDTPIFVLATAGMRLLPPDKQQALLGNICSYVRSQSDLLLPDCARSVQIIDGPTEGLYGWLATNYLLGSFDNINPASGSAGNRTYGFLDMGGASAQIAFAPTDEEAERDADDLTLLRLRTLDGKSLEHRLFTTSWLGYGVHQARDRYLSALLKSRPKQESAATLQDPCLPQGFTDEHRDVKLAHNSTQSEPLHIVGTGDYDACLRQTYPLLEKTAPCPEAPCPVHGVHVPAIDFEINHFIGVSEWWHTTHQVSGLARDDERYDFTAYQRSLRRFCGTPWAEIQRGVEERRYGKKVDFEEASEICFKASWMVNLLHEGIGVPRVGLDRGAEGAGNATSSASKHGGRPDTFRALDKIGSTEISWTLGKAVLVASADVPPAPASAPPVGFGANLPPHAPASFHEPGAAPPAPAQDGRHWHDRLFDVEAPRRAPGFALFVLILLIAAFYMLGRDRRRRLFRRVFAAPEAGVASSRVGGFFKGKLLPFFRPAPAPYDYERVLEEGLADFELGDIPTPPRAGRARHASPRPSTSGSAESYHARPHATHEASARSSTSDASENGVREEIDRRGLALRTESSDHVPSSLSIGSTHTGRKSRGGSPVRRASSRSPP